MSSRTHWLLDRTLTHVCAPPADDQEGKSKPGGKEGRGSSKLAGKGAAAGSKKSTRPPVGRLAAFTKKAHKLFFGWLDPRLVCQSVTVCPCRTGLRDGQRCPSQTANTDSFWVCFTHETLVAACSWAGGTLRCCLIVQVQAQWEEADPFKPGHLVLHGKAVIVLLGPPFVRLWCPSSSAAFCVTYQMRLSFTCPPNPLGSFLGHLVALLQ
jgi:hypothetical protein